MLGEIPVTCEVFYLDTNRCSLMWCSEYYNNHCPRKSNHVVSAVIIPLSMHFTTDQEIQNSIQKPLKTFDLIVNIMRIGDMKTIVCYELSLDNDNYDICLTNDSRFKPFVLHS